MAASGTEARHGQSQTALDRIERQLGSDPAAAEREAAALLAADPGNEMAGLFLGIARRLNGNAQGAIDVLEPLCRNFPQAPLAQLQLGLALRESSRHAEAAAAVRRALAIKPDFIDAALALAEICLAAGDRAGASAAFMGYLAISGRDPLLAQAGAHLAASRYTDAEALLRRRLHQHPHDIAAMCLMAEVAARHEFLGDSERLLRRCLEFAPGYRAALHNLAITLMWQNRPAEALVECEKLLAADPRDIQALQVKANIELRLGNYQLSEEIFRQVLEQEPRQAQTWTSLGHVLRTVGRRAECIEAYRKAIALAPDSGEAYWSIASLRVHELVDADLDSMQAQVNRKELAHEDRVHFHFALAKGLEERGRFAESFGHYAEGNRLRRNAIRFDPSELTRLVERTCSVQTRDFFVARSGSGSPAEDPIFVVGMPRSGSTLVEQILASHSAIEGTTELPDILSLIKSLERRSLNGGGRHFPELLTSLDAAEFAALGQAYLDQTRVQRKQGRIRFVDKMPNNFAYAGFIHLILPRARIIDVRRHPLSCGMSLYKLLFSHGQGYSYSLEEIGRHYSEYVKLMAHIDAVLPGRVHRVHYEALVDAPEIEVRRLLEYCGLPFEEGCLRFHETERHVSTPSSEQVRQPLFRDGLEAWRNFEPWLGPLRSALGDLVDTYPALPAGLQAAAAGMAPGPVSG